MITTSHMFSCITGAVYATEDGWVPDEYFDFGNVTVRGYTFPPGNRVYDYKMSAGTSIASNNMVTMPSLLTDSHLISVQVHNLIYLVSQLLKLNCSMTQGQRLTK